MQQWINVDSLNEERGDEQLVALNSKVYALGGEDKLDTSGIPTNELPELGGYSVVTDSVEGDHGKRKVGRQNNSRGMTMAQKRQSEGGWWHGRWKGDGNDTAFLRRWR